MTQEKLEEAKRLYQTANADQKYVLESLFPELVESEDEVIRKELAEFVNQYGDKFYGQIAKASTIAWLEKQGKQKPATIDIDKMVDDYANNKERGNEEFGKPVPCMIRAYRQGLNDAIGKVVLKPAWSEKDEYVYNEILKRVADKKLYEHDLEYIYKWLKSLRPQNHWKPSDEQMEALVNAIFYWDSFENHGYTDNTTKTNLKSLLEQLKKLKG